MIAGGLASDSHTVVLICVVYYSQIKTFGIFSEFSVILYDLPVA